MPGVPWRSLFLVACIWVTSTAAAQAQEFWPELSLYLTLNPQTRIFLDMPYARGMESDVGALELAAYVDVSITPVGRPALQKLDWQRNRYLWARIGLDHVFETGGGGATLSENRAIISLWSKAGLPAKIVLEGRARVDLRDIDGDVSARYRFRLELAREFMVLHHPVVPYANVEWFYDTRYDGWARMLYQAGAEFTVSRHFRCELYLARQEDDLPEESGLNALGVVLKWFY